MSLASARARPNPAAGPLTAAITGCGVERTLDGAEQIAGWAPWGIRLTKQGMWTALEISEQAAIEYEDRQQIMAVHGTAMPEAISAFLEKRKPEFAD